LTGPGPGQTESHTRTALFFAASLLFIEGIEALKKIISIFKEDLTPIRPGRKNERNKKNVKAFYQTYSDI